ncbi:conserved hypothetical protein [Treponema phagedenis]|uniref:Transposase n=1 Tax=Treponema phagedenis TaxID=162 RepID=A0A0B7GSC6_TREPH|nr:transposase [Treponema phagedenis]CEM61489.1 conserved hypothetical protein [Treponema phagedenis]
MRRYSQEFKQQALQLSDEIDTKESAKNLGISYGTLTDWRKTKNRYKASDGAATAKAIVLDERERQLQKELLYRIDTTKMMREQVKTLVWQYTMVYYNRKRISTVNEDGLPPTLYRLKVTRKRMERLEHYILGG